MASLIKKSHRGLLHKRLHVPQGQPIPRQKIESDLARAKKNHDVKAERQDEFALNFDHRQHMGG